MSWDEKDWHYITFWGEDVEVVKQASFEYDGKERYYDRERKCISIYESDRNLWPLDNEELQILQNISNKYSIKVTYWFCGQGTKVFNPQNND
jgi:hypothetical protein